MRHTDTLRIAIAAGGTGGHISPAVALIEHLRNSNLPFDAIWIGSKGPFERQAAVDLSIPFHAVRVGKLRRYVSPHTLTDALRVPVGTVESARLIRRWRPDVIFSTGGYVGVPAVIAGHFLNVPSLTHEQTALLGLATRINCRYSDTIALSFDSTPRPKVRRHGRIAVTGNPVRSSIRSGDPAEAVRFFGLARDRPLVYVTGGAQGAQAINQAVEASLDELLRSVEIIHQCGPREANGDIDRLLAAHDRLPDDLAARYHPVERIGPELRHIYAAACLVIGRAGAGTVNELAALGLPSILIPLPGALEQHRNAEALATSGGAVLIEQENLTSDSLISTVTDLVTDDSRLAQMSEAARCIAKDDAVERLADEIMRLANRSAD